MSHSAAAFDPFVIPRARIRARLSVASRHLPGAQRLGQWSSVRRSLKGAVATPSASPICLAPSVRV